MTGQVMVKSQSLSTLGSESMQNSSECKEAVSFKYSKHAACNDEVGGGRKMVFRLWRQMTTKIHIQGRRLGKTRAMVVM